MTKVASCRLGVLDRCVTTRLSGGQSYFHPQCCGHQTRLIGIQSPMSRPARPLLRGQNSLARSQTQTWRWCLAGRWGSLSATTSECRCNGRPWPKWADLLKASGGRCRRLLKTKVSVVDCVADCGGGGVPSTASDPAKWKGKMNHGQIIDRHD